MSLLKDLINSEASQKFQRQNLNEVNIRFYSRGAKQNKSMIHSIEYEDNKEIGDNIEDDDEEEDDNDDNEEEDDYFNN